MHDIFFFTDIHGMYDLYRAIMEYCQEQDPEAMIIFGGDACDRGPNGYRIMKELLDHPKVIYLMGNHEDMFVHAACFIMQDYHGSLDNESIFQYLLKATEYSTLIAHCVYNGGYRTLYDWMQDGMSREFVNRIINLPLTISYEGLDFCHAGGDPKVFKKISEEEYSSYEVDKDDKEMILWDRNWLGFGWIPDRTCVFGHTPVMHLPAKYYGQDKSTANAHPCKYIGQIDPRLNGYRLNMDTAAAFSGKAYVLNCLTMKAQGFYDEDFNDDLKVEHNVKKIDCVQM